MKHDMSDIEDGTMADESMTPLVVEYLQAYEFPALHSVKTASWIVKKWGRVIYVYPPVNLVIICLGNELVPGLCQAIT